MERKKSNENSLIQIPKSIIALSICMLKYLKADGISELSFKPDKCLLLTKATTQNYSIWPGNIVKQGH